MGSLEHLRNETRVITFLPTLSGSSVSEPGCLRCFLKSHIHSLRVFICIFYFVIKSCGALMEQNDSSEDDAAASLFAKAADASCVHAVASIVTAVIVVDETHNNMYYRNNRQIPAKQNRCTPPQTAAIITDVESGGLGFFFLCVFSTSVPDA